MGDNMTQPWIERPEEGLITTTVEQASNWASGERLADDLRPGLLCD